ncbi:50S ribosomal protein L29 [Salmonella enterica subsp. enterica serovar Montevideo]|nr:50S ribosomal protein L29 [Salmonella enterica subsp. enterica serovar Montevideo]
MESALNDMIANNQDREAFNEADIRYHEAVLQSVHNPVLQQSHLLKQVRRDVARVKTLLTEKAGA